MVPPWVPKLAAEIYWGLAAKPLLKNLNGSWIPVCMANVGFQLVVVVLDSQNCLKQICKNLIMETIVNSLSRFCYCLELFNAFGCQPAISLFANLRISNDVNQRVNSSFFLIPKFNWKVANISTMRNTSVQVIQ